MKHRRSHCRSSAGGPKPCRQPATPCNKTAVKRSHPTPPYPHSYPQRFPRPTVPFQNDREGKRQGERAPSYPCISEVESLEPTINQVRDYAQPGWHTIVKPRDACRSSRCGQGKCSGTRPLSESPRPRRSQRGLKWLRAGERTLEANHWFTKPGFKRHVDDVQGASPGQTRGKPDRSRYWETLDVQQ